MGWFKNDSSLIWGEEDRILNEDNTLVWDDPIKPKELLEKRKKKSKLNILRRKKKGITQMCP